MAKGAGRQIKRANAAEHAINQYPTLFIFQYQPESQGELDLT